MAKFLLPWFGGAAGVWATSLFFFQFVLLAGYAYAHGLTRSCTPSSQGKIHSFVLAGSAALLVILGVVWETPITPGPDWGPEGPGHPALQILGLLGASVGLPFFVLSSTGPLLQSWFGRSFPGISPYRLYALSNLGSLVGLAGYPLLVEWLLPLRTQATTWAWCYGVFAILCGYCAMASVHHQAMASPASQPPAGTGQEGASKTPSPEDWMLWLGLPACGSTLLLAATNHLCLGIAPVPFLWMLPLGIYLLSFILCFDSPRWYRRGVFQPLFVLAAALGTYAIYQEQLMRLVPEIGIHSLVVFAGCMVCHGELARRKPEPRYLTGFYLMVAAGGALGGTFVGLLAPFLFTGFWEYHLALWSAAALVSVSLWTDRNSWVYSPGRWIPTALLVAACLSPFALASAARGGSFAKDWRFPAMLVISLALIVKVARGNAGADTLDSSGLAKLSLVTAVGILGGVLTVYARVRTLDAVRNFYGVISITEANPDDAEWRSYRLRHGPILHGSQFIESSKRRIPTTYYGVKSAVGLVAVNHPRRNAPRLEDRPLRIGVVGLGVGTIATYGEAGDSLRFYEINPDIIRFAQRSYFTFLADTPAHVAIVPGDARLSMERELARHEPQQFDILVLDAFSGDSIPVHLLTREAFEIYLRHLRQPDGVIVVHVSNTYVDLRSVLWKIAAHFHLQPAWIFTSKVERISSACDWIILAPNRALLDLPEIASELKPDQFNVPAARLWTDDYSNVFRILKK